MKVVQGVQDIVIIKNTNQNILFHSYENRKRNFGIVRINTKCLIYHCVFGVERPSFCSCMCASIYMNIFFRNDVYIYTKTHKKSSTKDGNESWEENKQKNKISKKYLNFSLSWAYCFVSVYF